MFGNKKKKIKKNIEEIEFMCESLTPSNIKIVSENKCLEEWLIVWKNGMNKYLKNIKEAL